MVAATGVLVAAVFYILNMRETMKNRRATFANNIQQIYYTEEGQLRYMEVMSMQWSDFEDFKSKYDSSVNPKYYAKRQSILAANDMLGFQYRLGIISLDDFSKPTSWGLVATWLKFKPIIEKYREWQYSRDFFSDLEYLANAMMEKMGKSDPEFKEKMNVFFTTQQKQQ